MSMKNNFAITPGASGARSANLLIERRMFSAGLLATILAPLAQRVQAEPTWSLIDGLNVFGHQLFLKCLGRLDDNVVLSPLSLGLCTAMAALGAEGATAAEFGAALGLPRGAIASLPGLAKQLRDEMKNVTGLSLANGLALSGGKPSIEPAYIARLKEAFEAEVMADATVERVNAWVGARTGGRIPHLLDSIGELTLVNALFFEAGWQHPADKTETVTAGFTTGTGETLSVPRMVMRHITCVQQPKAQTFLLPYQNSAASMLIVLPEKGEALMDRAKALAPSMVRDLVGAHEALSGKDELHLPRFRIASKREMREPMKALGLGTMFDAKRADFSAMSTVRPHLYVSDVMHQTDIDVDEAGTTAAAATATIWAPGAVLGPPTIYIVDRPFLFYVVHAATRAVLIQGSVNNPA